MVRKKDFKLIEFHKDHNVKDKLLISFLIPLCSKNYLLNELIESIVSQSANYAYNIILVSNEIANENNQPDFGMLKKYQIPLQYYYYAGKEEISIYDAIRFGFVVSKAQWVCLLENNFVFLPGSIKCLGRIARNVNRCTQKETAFVSMGYRVSRIDITKGQIAKKELQRFMNTLRIKPYKNGLLEITPKHLETYGFLGIMRPQSGALYLRKAFLEYGKTYKNNYPNENEKLVIKMSKKYSVCVSLIHYGVYIRKECTYFTKEEMIQSVRMWCKYIDDYFEHKKFDCFKQIKKRYVQHMFVATTMNKNRSLGVQIEDMSDFLLAPPNRILFTWWSMIKTYLYSKYIEKQIDKNDCLLCDK